MRNDKAQNEITNNMLQYCYTCQNAHDCDTEAKCVACWEANGMMKEQPQKPLTTEELLVLYAL